MKIRLDKNRSIFFTSDLHLGYTNIVRGCSGWSDKSEVRNFDTLEEHDSTIIEGINKVVKATDVLFILGDVCFKGFGKAGVEQLKMYLNSINCRNIYLAYGNHDDLIRKNNDLQNRFVLTGDYFELEYEKGQPPIILSHYAMRSWNKAHYGSIMLFGHSHGSLEDYIDSTGTRRKTMDVGVDTNNYAPYSLGEILGIMETRGVANLEERLKRK